MISGKNSSLSGVLTNVPTPVFSSNAKYSALDNLASNAALQITNPFEVSFKAIVWPTLTL